MDREQLVQSREPERGGRDQVEGGQPPAGAADPERGRYRQRRRAQHQQGDRADQVRVDPGLAIRVQLGVDVHGEGAEHPHLLDVPGLIGHLDCATPLVKRPGRQRDGDRDHDGEHDHRDQQPSQAR